VAGGDDHDQDQTEGRSRGVSIKILHKFSSSDVVTLLKIKKHTRSQGNPLHPIDHPITATEILHWPESELFFSIPTNETRRALLFP
jgi:hypothetical protein